MCLHHLLSDLLTFTPNHDYLQGSTGWFCAGDFNSIVLALGEAGVLGWSHILMQLKSDLEINVDASFPGERR